MNSVKKCTERSINPQNNIDMKTIKDLTIKVTYRVGLGNVEVPDEVYNRNRYE